MISDDLRQRKTSSPWEQLDSSDRRLRHIEQDTHNHTDITNSEHRVRTTLLTDYTQDTDRHHSQEIVMTQLKWRYIFMHW